jgi:iron complex outermembrane receptor protein
MMSGLEHGTYAKYAFSGAISAALLCVCAPLSTFGQEAAGTPVDEQIQEIVVTAQHRVQSLQEVPISVTVLSGEAILESHLRDFSDLSLQTPSFTSGAITATFETPR